MSALAALALAACTALQPTAPAGPATDRGAADPDPHRWTDVLAEARDGTRYWTLVLAAPRG